MYYVYIIQSISHPEQMYVGCTEDLKKRLSNHNSGTTPHTDKYKPWKLMVYIAFENKTKAYEFEAFLKSGSGREFQDKRLFCPIKGISKPIVSYEDIDKFLNFLALRFGIYLDMMHGFKNNLKDLKKTQQKISGLLKVSIDYLDSVNFIYGDVAPQSGTELHRRT